ncbi:MAG: N-acetyltransferase [Burkholderiales bacterium]|nr:N-acetyltransferase [Burkholderiales bacterium]
MTARIRLATPHDASAIAQVRVLAWRATYRGMIPATYLDAMKVEDSAAQWERILGASPNSSNTFVAEDAGLVVGFASGLMLPAPKLGFDAELSAVYLDREQQRQGIGRRLVARVAAAQQAHGATGLLTWVIAANKGARAFYERLGAELVIEQPFQWDGMDLVEAGYGWRDLAALAALGDPSHLH